MIKPSTKIKRGTKYIVIETGDEVTHDNITFEGLHLVNYPNGNWHAFQYDELKPAPQKRTPISNKPKQLTTSEISDSKVMNNFFDSLIIPFNCECCGKPLYAFTKVAKRSVSAHIFQKAHFKSIKMNKDNILFMGADYIGCPCNCHDRWDSNSDTRKSTAIYPLALERFELLKPHMTNAEILEAHKCLGIPITMEILQELDIENLKHNGYSNND